MDLARFLGLRACFIFLLSFFSYSVFCLDVDSFLDCYGLEQCETNRLVFDMVAAEVLRQHPMSKPEDLGDEITASFEKLLSNSDSVLRKRNKRWLKKRHLLLLFLGLGIGVTIYFAYRFCKQRDEVVATEIEVLRTTCEEKNALISELEQGASNLIKIITMQEAVLEAQKKIIASKDSFINHYKQVAQGLGQSTFNVLEKGAGSMGNVARNTPGIIDTTGKGVNYYLDYKTKNQQLESLRGAGGFEYHIQNTMYNFQKNEQNNIIISNNAGKKEKACGRMARREKKRR